MKLELSAALIFVIIHRFVIAHDYNHLSKCPEYNPQNELDIDLISSSIWSGSELITHYESKKNFQSFDTCIQLMVEEIFEWQDYNYDYDDKLNARRMDFSPHRYRFLKVQLNEGDKSAVYTLKYNITKRGLWIGSEPPKGSMLKRHPHHSHFKGTIQVMKAVANHLVLSFCEQSEIFTIIFSRTKNIAVDDIESIHNLLSRRGLAIQSVRELCRYNSAVHVTTSRSLLLAMMLIAMLLSHNRNYF